jgi:hypothetical protein
MCGAATDSHNLDPNPVDEIGRKKMFNSRRSTHTGSGVR